MKLARDSWKLGAWSLKLARTDQMIIYSQAADIAVKKSLVPQIYVQLIFSIKAFVPSFTKHESNKLVIAPQMTTRELICALQKVKLTQS